MASWNLLISSKDCKSLPFGVQSFPIEVTSVANGKPIAQSVFVRMYKHRPIDVSPNELFFGELERKTVASRSLVVVSGDRRTTAIAPTIAPSADPRLRCSLVESQPRLCRFQVTFQSGDKLGFVDCPIKIAFGRSEDLLVAVRCRARVVDSKHN